MKKNKCDDGCKQCGTKLTALTQFSHGVCIDCFDGSVMKAISISNEQKKED